MKLIFIAGREGETSAIRGILSGVNVKCKSFVLTPTLMEEAQSLHPDLFILAFELAGKTDNAISQIRKDPMLQKTAILACYPASLSNPESRGQLAGASDTLMFPPDAETLLTKTAALLHVEKRRTFKALLTVEAKNGHSYSARSEDFSAAGISFVCECKLIENTEVRVMFFMPGASERLSIPAVITRRKELPDGDCFYGAKFLPLEPELAGQIKSFVDRSR